MLLHGEPRLAQRAGCAGVHLPAGGDVGAARALLHPSAWVSISAHSTEEVLAAAEAGADAVTLSPIFASASKPGYGPALGLERLGEVAAVSPLPVIALGGIEDEGERARMPGRGRRGGRGDGRGDARGGSGPSARASDWGDRGGRRQSNRRACSRR